MVLYGLRMLEEESKCNAPMVRFEMLKSVIARKVLLSDSPGAASGFPDVSEKAFLALLTSDIERINAYYTEEEKRGQDPRSLRRYAAVNYVGARKIAKKFDKNASLVGEPTCRKAVEALLAKQHFASALKDDDFAELDAANYWPPPRVEESLPVIEEEQPSYAVDFWSTYVAYGFVYSCRRALAVAKEPLSTSVSTATLSSLDSVLLGSYVTMQLVVARHGDLIRIKPQVLVGLAVLAAALATWATGVFTQNLPLMYAFWASNGIAQALVYPYVCVVIAAQVAASKRGRVMGAWNTCSATGGVVSAALSAAALKRRGFRGAFDAPALATFLCGLVVLAVLNRPRASIVKHQGSTSKKGDVPVWKMARVPIVCAAYSLVKPIRYLFLFWHNYYLTAQLSLSVEKAALVEAVETLGALLGGLAFGAASDRVPPFVLFAVCLAALSLALLAFRPVSTLSLYADVTIVALVSSLVGAVDNLASGLTAAALVELNERTKGNSASIASVVSFLSAAGTLGTLVHGRLLQRLVPTNNWAAVFGLVAAQAATAATLIAPMAFDDWKRKRKVD